MVKGHNFFSFLFMEAWAYIKIGLMMPFNLDPCPSLPPFKNDNQSHKKTPPHTPHLSHTHCFQITPSTMLWLRTLAARPARPAYAHSPSLLHALHFSSAAAAVGADGGDAVPPAGLGPTEPGEKPRIVVLGSGWAGCRLMKGVDTSLYDVVCVSPRNHMVFTPLLASTCVGTLEFRSVAEPIGRIQPAVSRVPGSYFFLGNCSSIDHDNRLVGSLLFSILAIPPFFFSFFFLSFPSFCTTQYLINLFII